MKTNRSIKTILTTYFLILNLLPINAQQEVLSVEEVHWDVLNTEIIENTVRVTINTTIPDGWMIQTEGFTERGFPFGIGMEDDLKACIETIEIKQTNGDRFIDGKASKLFQEDFKVTDGYVEYQITIVLKKNHNLRQIGFGVEYMQFDESTVLPPQTQAFLVKMNE